MGDNNDGGDSRGQEGFAQASLEAVAIWCLAAQGAMSIAQALRRIANMLKADIAAIARVDHASPSRENGPSAYARVVAFDRRSVSSAEVAGFRVSYAEAICGGNVIAAKPGTIWKARTADFENDPRLHSPLSHRKLVATVVIALQHHSNSSDFVELHFREETSAAFANTLTQLGPVLATAWKGRVPGLMLQNMITVRRADSRRDPASDAAVLSVDNPCELSRAEYRVCLLLSNGLNRDAVRRELSIGLSTLRSHLSNVYAKTGTSSQAELVQRLLARPVSIGTRDLSHMV